MKDLDSEDFKLPPSDESLKLEDEVFGRALKDIWQHEEGQFDLMKDGNTCESEKSPLPPVHCKSASVKWASPKFDEASGDNLAERGTPGYVESDDETDNIEEEMLMSQHFELGEMLPPDLDLLTRTLKPVDGKPRNLLAQVWVCPVCNESHDGIKNLIFDTQAYKCRRCKKQNYTSYNWSLTRVKLNGVSLDFCKIYNQRREKKCLLLAFLALCDMMRRVRGAKRGWDEATPFDSEAMLAAFKRTTGWELESSPCLPRVGERHPHVECMLQAAVLHGVPYSSVTQFDRYVMKRAGEKLSVPKRILKVPSWFRVNCGDVETMIRVIAHGFPLLAIVPLGKCFEHVPSGEVYHAPRAEECFTTEPEDSCITHAVVIHGSSITVPDCQFDSMHIEGVYFKCRNSHGTKAHKSWEEKGEGADFNVWAVDILNDVYGINLLDSDEEEEMIGSLGKCMGE